MESYIVQKKSVPYVNGGVWCVDIIISSSDTGKLYKDIVYGGRKRDLLNIKKGDIHIPKAGKTLEKVE